MFLPRRLFTTARLNVYKTTIIFAGECTKKLEKVWRAYVCVKKCMRIREGR
jgi:hypothetical protein